MSDPVLSALQMKASPERLQQIRQRLGVGSAFELIEATQILDLYTSFGVVQVPLPPGEFLVGMQDPGGCRRFGVVRFSCLDDREGWG
ncbi:hypothetical protein [Pseudomonas sp. SCB32]|uniref:hypothetical protein n=1 Tax=Pseudomonas sp. SCB32 TaxID=2653853 RepID=UPI0012651231|nr:hypothetical protein [Pseudomonas sp. SCB32]